MKKFILLAIVIGLVITSGFYFADSVYAKASASSNSNVLVSPIVSKASSAPSADDLKKWLNSVLTNSLNGDPAKTVHKYFTNDFQKLYTKVDVVDQSLDEIGFWCGDLWDGAQDDHTGYKIVNTHPVSDTTIDAEVDFIGVDGESSNREILRCIYNNGTWLIDDIFDLMDYENDSPITYNSNLKTGTKKAMRDYLKGYGIDDKNYKPLKDLISFKDIINTNADFESLVKTHGFKHYEAPYEKGDRFVTHIYYKNCIIRNDDVVPSGNGTSICISNYLSMWAVQYTITVYNQKAYRQLVFDFLDYAKYENEEKQYVFQWADGRKSILNGFEFNEYKNQKRYYLHVNESLYEDE